MPPDASEELHFGGLGLRDPAAPHVDQDRLRGGGAVTSKWFFTLGKGGDIPSGELW